MKKSNVKKLALNKKAISKIQGQAVSGGDVSLPDPATGIRCDITGANFCVSWNACETLPNFTCIYTGPTKPIDTTPLTKACGTTMNTNCHTTQIGC
ncbi:MAG: hypothetical protein AAF611_06385 [Bacteroidota bacterium]